MQTLPSRLRPDPESRPAPIGLLAATMVAGTLVLALAALDADVPGRAVLAVVSALTVPGVPLALALPITDRLVQTVLAVALSLASLLVVVTAQLVAGLWSPVATQAILVGVGFAGTALAVRPAAAR